jgi:hypothetical protein
MGAAVIVRKRLLPLLLVYRRPGLTEAGHVRFWQILLQKSVASFFGR